MNTLKIRLKIYPSFYSASCDYIYKYLNSHLRERHSVVLKLETSQAQESGSDSYVGFCVGFPNLSVSESVFSFKNLLIDAILLLKQQ